jgi:hypothetical protein
VISEAPDDGTTTTTNDADDGILITTRPVADVDFDFQNLPVSDRKLISTQRNMARKQPANESSHAGSYDPI